MYLRWNSRIYCSNFVKRTKCTETATLSKLMKLLRIRGLLSLHELNNYTNYLLRDNFRTEFRCIARTATIETESVPKSRCNRVTFDHFGAEKNFNLQEMSSRCPDRFVPRRHEWRSKALVTWHESKTRYDEANKFRWVDSAGRTQPRKLATTRETCRETQMWSDRRDCRRSEISCT